VRQPVTTPDDIANAFDTITYLKGGAVIRMFENWAGTEAFRKGVQVYLKRRAWGNATAPQFLHDVSEGSGKDIQAAFLTFLEQPGVPLVTAALRCGAGAPVLQLSQKRYLPLGSPGSASETWRIPVCLRYGAGGRVEQQCTMLDTPTAEVKLGAGACPEWLAANAEEKGYYHVEYGGGLLGKLAADGGRRLTEPERAGVLADSRALMRGGEVPASGALEMARSFALDPQREVVASGIGIVAGMEAYVPPALSGKYAAFVRNGFGARAEALGWKPRKGESENDRLLRPTLVGFVARSGDDKKLASEARKLAERWLSDRTAVHAEVLAAVLDTAAQYGDAALFDRFLAAAKAERNQRDRAAAGGAWAVPQAGTGGARPGKNISTRIH
jgi:alanyl aminopeptidase